MMASDPAEGRSASTQRSTVAGDAKPIVTMIECEAGHTRPDARAARATNSTDQQCPTARAVTSPGQSRIEAISSRASMWQPPTRHILGKYQVGSVHTQAARRTLASH